jgi:HSP20 family protein
VTSAADIGTVVGFGSKADVRRLILDVRFGEKRLDFDEEKENYHVMERRYGSFQRSLRVPDTVDDRKVEARFENGVLKVTLPKRPEAGGAQRKIDIKKS